MSVQTDFVKKLSNLDQVNFYITVFSVDTIGRLYDGRHEFY